MSAPVRYQKFVKWNFAEDEETAKAMLFPTFLFHYASLLLNLRLFALVMAAVGFSIALIWVIFARVKANVYYVRVK